MSISPHLRRKLKEQLGTDAGEDLVAQLGRMDPILAEIAAVRTDIGQLRHDMQLGFARADARMETLSRRGSGGFRRREIVRIISLVWEHPPEHYRHTAIGVGMTFTIQEAE